LIFIVASQNDARKSGLFLFTSYDPAQVGLMA